MISKRKRTVRKSKNSLYGRRKGGRNYKKSYPFDLRLKCVKLKLEDGHPGSLIERETGVSAHNIFRWVKLYKENGEDGLRNRHSKRPGQRIAGQVREKAIELKKNDSRLGVRSISNFLRRIFLLQASPETVRKTLHEENLIGPPKKKRKKNITRPRFFERATPNQMWQSDIFTFRLGGRYAYLIGYIDDYSRYITGLGLFRSQTAEHVLEVYRTAMAEYNPPKEMLTDNGRQYTAWRGTTKFEMELKKDRIKHIKSQPHHPMTLGKIERFWKTIFEEFLGRTQFNSFEEARTRLAQWVSYYNHKRPHQGIGGLCPADRYFEVASTLKRTIQEGIQENILEMALRGQPRSPFYMVGRMEGQSVVLKAEKGKLKLSVDDSDGKNTRELTYNLDKGVEDGEKDNNSDTATERPAGKQEDAGSEFKRHGEDQGGAVGMDGEQEALGGVPGAADTIHDTELLAEQGAGGDTTGSGAESEPGERTCPACPAAEVPGETAEHNHPDDKCDQPERAAEENQYLQESEEPIFEKEITSERKPHETIPQKEKEPGGVFPEAGGDDNKRPLGADNGHRRRPPTGDLQEIILPVGAPWSRGLDDCPGGESTGASGGGDRPGKGSPEEESSTDGERTSPGEESQRGEDRFPEVGT
jgi:transposase InsO family protein